MGDAQPDTSSSPPPSGRRGCVAPCGSCPWRRGADPARIPNFDALRADTSLRRVAGAGDAFRPIMACHLSTGGGEVPCVGYVVSDDGYSNLAVRVAAIDGAVDLVAMRAACEDLELHDSFAGMLAALFARLPDPRLRPAMARGRSAE